MTAAPVTEFPAELVELAQRLADAGAPVIRRHFRTPITVDDKADASPVTVADRETEATIRAILEAERPDHGIIGEEYGNKAPEAEWVWVIDPIDGTKSFITGRPIFGTLIALLHHGVPVLGVINQPIINDRWVGAAGRATTFNGAPTRVRGPLGGPGGGIGAAVMGTTSPDLFPDEDFPAFRRVADDVKVTVYGGDCHTYGLLASGYFDLVIESGLKLYDFAALVPVVTGAGGIMTDWEGRPLGRHSTGRVIAAGDAAIHAEAVRRLAP